VKYGDIDNKPSPAVVVDIDGLVIMEPNIEKVGYLRRLLERVKSPSLLLNKVKAEVDQYTLIDRIYPVLEGLFFNDITVYLFAHRPSVFKEPLEEKLEPFIYSSLFVGGIKERESLLSRRYVHLYYYKKAEHSSILYKNKERWIQAYNEIDLW